MIQKFKISSEKVRVMIVFLDRVENWECLYEECSAKCCSEGIELTLEDVERISKRHSDFFRIEDTRILLKGKDGRCIFLRDDLKCGIEDIKPVACRLLPFVIHEVRYGDEPFIKLRLVVDCPGVGNGNNVDLGEIERNATVFLHEKQELLMKLREDRNFLKNLFP